ncbi:MAG: GGDEF domain-containing response regulator [Rhodocyclaceae bacterium]|jgi:diguanylate cyclase (GGDEF)-like protein|nr:GGDEF domain-containing response regulator [Rhodocyclaceae bacterium]
MNQRFVSAPRSSVLLRVLLVDDSEDDAFLLRAELARRGLPLTYHRVDCEIDLAAALTQDEWDLVISDHCMPGFDAFGALETLKRSGRDLPFVLLSGHIPEQLAVAAMSQGVDDFVEKGNYDRLIPVIEREIRGAAARQAARQAEQHLRQVANFDALCALPNKHLFCAKVADWIADTRRRGKPCQGTLLALDLDRFLRINASLGYAAGDDILRAVAQRLVETLDADVLVGRLGSDEFGVFVPGESSQESADIFARWVRRIFDKPFLKGREEVVLSASIGIAPVEGATAEAFECLLNAETAMAQVKRAGGNGYRFFELAMSQLSAETLALEGDLRGALDRGELFLVYQPVVDGESGVTLGVEALLRWRHPERGVVPPDRFIPVADETGLIVEIGTWVLAEACRQCRQWQLAGDTELRISVNVSAVQFGQPSLLGAVASALSASGLSAASLMLEITETSIMRDVGATAAMLRALKDMGVRIAVDDFGTGYSSLSYLKRFPIDIIKIDKSFVRDLCEDDEDAAIVRAIIALAHSMRRETIAEGVESGEQLALLLRERCGLLQGYHLGRPVPAEEISQRLAEEALHRADGKIEKNT